MARIKRNAIPRDLLGRRMEGPYEVDQTLTPRGISSLPNTMLTFRANNNNLELIQGALASLGKLSRAVNAYEENKNKPDPVTLGMAADAANTIGTELKINFDEDMLNRDQKSKDDPDYENMLIENLNRVGTDFRTNAEAVNNFALQYAISKGYNYDLSTPDGIEFAKTLNKSVLSSGLKWMDKNITEPRINSQIDAMAKHLANADSLQDLVTSDTSSTVDTFEVLKERLVNLSTFTDEDEHNFFYNKVDLDKYAAKAMIQAAEEKMVRFRQTGNFKESKMALAYLKAIPGDKSDELIALKQQALKQLEGHESAQVNVNTFNLLKTPGETLLNFKGSDTETRMLQFVNKDSSIFNEQFKNTLNEYVNTTADLPHVQHSKLQVLLSSLPIGSSARNSVTNAKANIPTIAELQKQMQDQENFLLGEADKEIFAYLQSNTNPANRSYSITDPTTGNKITYQGEEQFKQYLRSKYVGSFTPLVIDSFNLLNRTERYDITEDKRTQQALNFMELDGLLFNADTNAARDHYLRRAKEDLKNKEITVDQMQKLHDASQRFAADKVSALSDSTWLDFEQQLRVRAFDLLGQDVKKVGGMTNRLTARTVFTGKPPKEGARARIEQIILDVQRKWVDQYSTKNSDIYKFLRTNKEDQLRVAVRTALYETQMYNIVNDAGKSTNATLAEFAFNQIEKAMPAFLPDDFPKE
tara:strand:- start:8591 stop:10684 length:2094 start_codon:yes stop_codon:yes gene_type:complete